MGKYSKRRHERQEEAVVNSSSLAIIMVCVVLGLIFLTIGVSTVNYIQSFGKIEKLQTTKETLETKYASVKPQVTEESAVKLDLEAKEKKLTKVYKMLVSYAYGGMTSADDLDKNKDEFENWFAPVGTEKIKKDVVLKSGKKKSLLAKENLNTYVTFGQVDKKYGFVDIVIYTTYKVNKDTGQQFDRGQTLITITYDLANMRVMKTNFRTLAVN